MTRLGCSRDRFAALACLVALGGGVDRAAGHADPGDEATMPADAGYGAAKSADRGQARAEGGACHPRSRLWPTQRYREPDMQQPTQG
jgi:hypothetical protein